jgi:hypothetical protein
MAASWISMRPLTWGASKGPRTVASAVTRAGSVEVATEFPDDGQIEAAAHAKIQRAFPIERQLAGDAEIGRPSHQAGALHRNDGVGHGGHQGAVVVEGRAAVGRPASGAGPISNFEMRNSAFISCGLSAGPSMRSWPSAEPANREAALAAEGAIQTRNRAKSRLEKATVALPG